MQYVPVIPHAFANSRNIWAVGFFRLKIVKARLRKYEHIKCYIGLQCL